MAGPLHPSDDGRVGHDPGTSFPSPFEGRPSGQSTIQRKEQIMGLDIYAEIKADPVTSPVDFKVENSAEIHYWRIPDDMCSVSRSTEKQV